MLSSIARLLLRIGGWTMVGEAPTIRKAVVIAAPHTSNWDGVWALIYKVAIGVEIHFFAKESLFWFPLSTLLRGLGGIPLDRDKAGTSVSKAIAAFEQYEAFFFGLAPEGTRALKPHWKTGFYRIALGADVPVILGFLDYGNRRLGLGPTIRLSGNKETDLSMFRSFYADIEGRWPAKTSPIVFPGN